MSSTRAVPPDQISPSEFSRALSRDPVVRIAGIAFLGVILLYLTRPFDPEAWPHIVEAYLVPLIMAITVGAIVWGLRKIERRRERRFWQLWAMAIGLWLAIQLAYAFPPDIDGWILALGVESATAAFYLSVLYALSLHPHSGGERGDDVVRRRLEGLAVSVFMFALVIYFVVLASVLQPEVYDSWTPSLTLYVLLDALVLVRLVYLRWHTPSPRWTALYTGLAITAFLWTATGLFEGLANVGLAPAPGWGTGVLDWAWFLPYATLIVTARMRGLHFPAAEMQHRPASPQESRGGWSGVVIGCVVGLPLLHMALSLSGVTDPGLHDPREMLVLLAVFVLGGLALVYQRSLEGANRRLEEEQRARDRERVVEQLADATLRERQRSAQVLAEAQNSRRLGVMSAGIAQDFDGLFKVILANAGLARVAAESGRDLNGALSRIEDVVRRGSQLTNQIMAQAGRAQVHVQAIDLNELVSTVGEQLRATTFEGTAIRYEMSTGLPHVYGDITQVTKVARTLMTLALEGHDAGLGAVTVRTRALYVGQPFASGTQWGRKLPPGHYLELQVVDHGPGIDPEAIALILDPFPVVDLGNDDPEWTAILSALGIHGGSIAIDSEPAGGKIVTVMFPIMEPTSRADGESAQRGVGRQPLRSGTVLIVDPEPSIGTMLRMPLERSGFTVLTAADGPEGIRAFRDHGVDLSAVLLDSALAYGAGETPLSEMHDLNPEVPVLLMVGAHSSSVFAGPRNAMAAGFLRKPFDPQTALDRLRDVIGG